MADISKINPNGTEYNLKDATARAGIESSKTLKSSVVTVPDASPINAEDITVDITPVQDLHGYDKPWAGGAGKNKLPMTVAGIKALNTGGTWSGNTYTKDGVSVTVLSDNGGNVTGFLANGSTTASEAVSFDLCRTDTFPTGSYILNGCPAGGGGGTTAYYIKATSGSTNVYDTGEGKAINIASSSLIVSIFIGNSNNKTFYPMLRLSTETDATFAPYSNECPLEGRTGAELDRCGKNWFDPNNLETFDANGEGAIRTGHIYREAGAYTVTNGTGSTIFCRLVKQDLSQYDSYTTLLSGSNNSFNVPSGYMLYVYYQENATPNLIQVERGSQVTTYEPYQHAQATITFGETVYGCTVDFNTGKAVVNRGYATLPSVGWYHNSGWNNQSAFVNGNGILSGVKPVSGYNTRANAITDAVNIDTPANIAGYTDRVGIGIGNGTDVFISLGENYDTNEKLETYLTNNPIHICYELATPYTLNLTPAQLKLLKGTNTLTCNGATITLKYQPDNVIGELKGEIEDIKDSAKVKGRYPIQSTASSGSYKFEIDVYRRGDIIGVDSFAFDRDQSCPSGYVSTVLPNVALNHYKPIEDAFFVFRHISGKGVVKITLRDDGQVGFSCYITESMTGDVAQDGWLFEQNWIQLAADLFNN